MSEITATIPAIIVICYMIGLGVKAAEAIPDKLIPVIVGVSGAVLGIIGMLTMQDFPAHDILSALAVGIASGLASTGANEVLKTLRGQQ